MYDFFVKVHAFMCGCWLVHVFPASGQVGQASVDLQAGRRQGRRGEAGRMAGWQANPLLCRRCFV